MSIKRARRLNIILGSLVFSGAACSPASDPAAKPARQVCQTSPLAIGEFVSIPAGDFIKGAAPVYPEETPTLRVQVAGFLIQKHEVTRAQFAEFVAATGYLTDAERSVAEARLGAGSAVFSHPEADDDPSAGWRLVETANWRNPEGDAETVLSGDTHPVVHVSKRDAEAYAEWAGGRLPSEVEWEYAATLGLSDPAVSTSGAYQDDQPIANTWQGVFPIADLGSDGYRGAAPVGCFAPDALGLYDMIGNVWEWTSTPYSDGTHTIKGGSYLCANNFCRRYRPEARQPQESDFSTNHIGFRIVKDASGTP